MDESEVSLSVFVVDLLRLHHLEIGPAIYDVEIEGEDLKEVSEMGMADC